MSIAEYAYINAKVGGMKSYLLGVGELKSLMEVQSYEDCLSLLKNTVYGRDISKLSSPTLMEIENIFMKALLSDYDKIMKPLSGNAKLLLEELMKKFEVSALKTIIEMKTAGFTEKEMKGYPWILTKIMTEPLLEKIMQLESVEELIDILKFTEYYEPLKEAMPKYQEMETATPFIIALDKYLYTRIGDAIENLSGLDREKARLLLGSEIDTKNLIIAIRARGMPEDEVWDSFIPYKYRLTDVLLRGILGVSQLNQLATELPEFGYTRVIALALKEYEKTRETLPYDMAYVPLIIEAAEEYERTESFLPLELSFRRFLYNLNRQAFFGNRFHIGVPLAYLNLKENEVKNLIAILKAKEVGLPSSEIEGLVVY
jgi:V/A-type H+-transporting ATPase subunit C